MKGAGEEYGKLLQVVQSYAVDNPGVAFSCKKAGESAADLHTSREHGTRDTLARRRAPRWQRSCSRSTAPTPSSASR